MARCFQDKDRPFAGTSIVEFEALGLVSACNRVGLRIEEAGENDDAAGRERLLEVRGELDQRTGEDIRDEQVERCARGEHRRVHPVRDRKQELACAVAELDAVDRGILAGDVHRDRIDVGGNAARLRPKRERRESEQAGAGPDVGHILECAAVNRERVERREAACSGCMLAGAKGQTRVDFEIDRIRRTVGMMHRRMDKESAGADRLQTLLALRDPVGGIFEMLDLSFAGTQ